MQAFAVWSRQYMNFYWLLCLQMLLYMCKGNTFWLDFIWQLQIGQIISAECKYVTRCIWVKCWAILMETSTASLCVRASLLAQECWHQACSPDRQLHCSGVFNMPDQDPGVLEAPKTTRELHQEMIGRLHSPDWLWWQVRHWWIISLNLFFFFFFFFEVLEVKNDWINICNIYLYIFLFKLILLFKPCSTLAIYKWYEVQSRFNMVLRKTALIENPSDSLHREVCEWTAHVHLPQLPLCPHVHSVIPTLGHFTWSHKPPYSWH